MESRKLTRETFGIILLVRGRVLDLGRKLK